MMHEFEVCFRIENKSNQVIKAAHLMADSQSLIYILTDDEQEAVGLFTVSDVVSITRLPDAG